MFKVVQLEPYCAETSPDMFKLVHYEAYTVGQQAGGWHPTGRHSCQACNLNAKYKLFNSISRYQPTEQLVQYIDRVPKGLSDPKFIRFPNVLNTTALNI